MESINKTVKHILETTLIQDGNDDPGSEARKAIITLEDDVFRNCRFFLSSNSHYSLGDWMFLREVALEIHDQAFPVKKDPD